MSHLLKEEDYWAIWIGMFLLLVGLLIFCLDQPRGMGQLSSIDEILKNESEFPFKTTAWYIAQGKKRSIEGSKTTSGKWLKKLTGKPFKWVNNPIQAFSTSQKQVARNQKKLESQLTLIRSSEGEQLRIAQKKEAIAKEAEFKNLALNQQAEFAIEKWKTTRVQLKQIEKKYHQKEENRLIFLFGLFLVLATLFGIGYYFMGLHPTKFLTSFAAIFLLTILAYTLGAQASLKAYGLGYAFWAILIGLVISNTVGVATWLKPALSTEFYIKTGLVLLGAEILLGKILAIGLPGIFVAWVVTPIVLISTYYFGQKVIKMKSKTLNMTIAADMSVCGVSAAVAVASACRAKKEELTLAVGLSMIFTSIMMVVMPFAIQKMDIPEVLGGAWIGGTIDASGAVVAAGAFLGEKALKVAATIKMVQNILIGLIAFLVAIYFSKKDQNNNVTWKEIFHRFPKFILGFLGASIIFSLLHKLLGEVRAYALIDQGIIASFSKNLRGWCFGLAFTSIGLSTNFKELKSLFKGGKPLTLYLCGQGFNLILTLLMAYLMFYVIFPDITSQI